MRWPWRRCWPRPSRPTPSASRPGISRSRSATTVYEARPTAGQPAPIVVCISEIWGVHELVRDVTRRFAKAGYYAVAPELFKREGGVAQIPNIQDILKIVLAVPRKQVLGDIAAAVAWYGPPARPYPDQPAPVTGFDVAKDIKIPLLGLYGELDTSPTPADARKLGDLVKQHNPNVELVVYPGAQHGFFADYRPSFNAAAAADGWKRCTDWFGKYLKA